MNPILNFLLSLLLMCIMLFLCAFLFIWANIEEIKLIGIIPDDEDEKENEK